MHGGNLKHNPNKVFAAGTGLLLFIACLSATPLKAENPVDLTRVCTAGGACSPRSWWIIPGFKDEYVSGVKSNQGWIRYKKFPIHMQEVFPDHKGPAVYSLRTRFSLSPEFLKGHRQPGIQFAEIGDVYEIYINGRLIGKQGEFKDGKVVFARMVRGLTYPVNPSLLKIKDNELLIKAAGDPRFEQFAMYFDRGYSFGFYDELKESASERIDLILIALYLSVGLYHLLLFLYRRQEKYNLHFGIFCVGLFVYLMTRTNIIFRIPWDTRIIHRIELFVLFLYLPHILLFLSSLYGSRARRAIYVFQGGSYLMAISVVFVPEWVTIHILRVWQIYMVLMLTPIFAYLTVLGIIKKYPDSRRLAMGAVALFIGGLFDVVDSFTLHTGLALQKYAFFGFIMFIALILANRFLRVHNQVEVLNRDLEKKVRARTSELERSLSEISLLKEKQDGDYYLTSLLINPLSANRAESETVAVDFLVRQFKRFRFRKWEAAIGGDICIAHAIRLQDREYTVVINADAMGKSMQGAGGALVFGAVITSVLNRARLSRGGGRKFPEQWLRDAYQELQSIFVSFQGSMMISAVIGLVDDATGLFYYVNAEHPYPIHYRGGDTHLLVDEDELRKIGTPEADENLRIHVLELRPGDVIFIGSDGKDDIVLGRDSEGRGIYNEDEGEFLNRVREGKADLHNIAEALHGFGELADDLTLVRVGYREGESESTSDSSGNSANKAQNHSSNRDGELEKIRAAIQADENERARSMLEEFVAERSENHEAALMLAEIYFRNGQFGRLREFAGARSIQFPAQDRFLFLAAAGAREDGDHKSAADFGERFRLRNPEDADNLLHLAETHHRMGNPARARVLWMRGRELAPKHAIAVRLEAELSAPSVDLDAHL